MPLLNIFLDDGGSSPISSGEPPSLSAWLATALWRCWAGLKRHGPAPTGRWLIGQPVNHRTMVDRLADPLSMSVLTAADFVGFYRAYQLRWVGGMCELLALPTPPEEECLDLAYRALGWITRRIHAALPGAIEAICRLHRQGYALHTASGSCSLELAGSFVGLGVRHCFGRLYGADLVNTFKEGAEYYARLFADAGVQPEMALVVDDSAEALDRAARLGARTVLVSSSPHPETGTTPRLKSLAELPAFLRRWA